MNKNNLFKRLGSDIPPGADMMMVYPARTHLPEDSLAFSNGRAALAWLCRQQLFRFYSVLLCAYTCPALVQFFRSLSPKWQIGFFDVGATAEEIERERAVLRTPCMVVLPALFGSSSLPVINKGGDFVLIDAMQCAFEPTSGIKGAAILTGPRKTTGLPDGAILTFPGAGRYRRQISNLPEALEPIVWKGLAHDFWARGADDFADEARKLGEERWPASPRRMSDKALDRYERLDQIWHRERRIDNARRMRSLLPKWTLAGTLDYVPYSFPILASNPNELVAYLHSRRIYATRLWHNAEHDPSTHKCAHNLTRFLVSLPIDQRCTPEDIGHIAACVWQVGKPWEPTDDSNRLQAADVE